jgi:hypothetical protein
LAKTQLASSSQPIPEHALAINGAAITKLLLTAEHDATNPKQLLPAKRILTVGYDASTTQQLLAPEHYAAATEQLLAAANARPNLLVLCVPTTGQWVHGIAGVPALAGVPIPIAGSVAGSQL